MEERGNDRMSYVDGEHPDRNPLLKTGKVTLVFTNYLSNLRLVRFHLCPCDFPWFSFCGDAAALVVPNSLTLTSPRLRYNSNASRPQL
ncbi:hypothetical protein HZH66_006515 [Vespula vulgaris]|uniref:Uncharacterized protein n=2 Tax=Vespula TaxID=7451 RepID=A0A834P1W7_VESPE|nr:hypothetical protein HZH66_006515 [Vespula vulgaris]KAF7425313.1 hypothetical protein H0235_007751 [Vespula pensylvanica]